MSNRKATWEEINDFVIRKLKTDITKPDTFHHNHLKIILEKVYPFSWSMYCKDNKLNRDLPKEPLRAGMR